MRKDEAIRKPKEGGKPRMTQLVVEVEVEVETGDRVDVEVEVEAMGTR